MAESFSSLPSMAASSMAASATYFAIGPAVSWSAVMGIMPYRLILPTAGLIDARRVLFVGIWIDPEVSVPILAVQRLAAVPMPELEPPVSSTARPSLKPPRRSGRGS